MPAKSDGVDDDEVGVQPRVTEFVPTTDTPDPVLAAISFSPFIGAAATATVTDLSVLTPEANGQFCETTDLFTIIFSLSSNKVKLLPPLLLLLPGKIVVEHLVQLKE